MTIDQIFNDPWIGILVGIIALVLCWGPRNVWDTFHRAEEIQEAT